MLKDKYSPYEIWNINRQLRYKSLMEINNRIDMDEFSSLSVNKMTTIINMIADRVNPDILQKMKDIRLEKVNTEYVLAHPLYSS